MDSPPLLLKQSTLCVIIVMVLAMVGMCNSCNTILTDSLGMGSMAIESSDLTKRVHIRDKNFPVDGYLRGRRV